MVPDLVVAQVVGCTPRQAPNVTGTRREVRARAHERTHNLVHHIERRCPTFARLGPHGHARTVRVTQPKMPIVLLGGAAQGRDGTVPAQIARYVRSRRLSVHVGMPVSGPKRVYPCFNPLGLAGEETEPETQSSSRARRAAAQGCIGLGASPLYRVASRDRDTSQ